MVAGGVEGRRGNIFVDDNQGCYDRKIYKANDTCHNGWFERQRVIEPHDQRWVSVHPHIGKLLILGVLAIEEKESVAVALEARRGTGRTTCSMPQASSMRIPGRPARTFVYTRPCCQ